MSYLDDYSRSGRAQEAEDAGMRPASRVGYGMTAKDVRAVARPSEWHHTGCRYRETDYYDVEDVICAALDFDGRKVLGRRKIKKIIACLREEKKRKIKIARLEKKQHDMAPALATGGPKIMDDVFAACREMRDLKKSIEHRRLERIRAFRGVHARVMMRQELRGYYVAMIGLAGLRSRSKTYMDRMRGHRELPRRGMENQLLLGRDKF